MKTQSVFCILLALLPAAAFAKIRVVTTLASFADIAQNVGGDEVDASSLTRGNQDPHFVDAKPDLILKLNRADLVIYAGLGLEDGWLPPLLTGSRNAKVQSGSEGNFNASSFMALKESPQGQIDRSQGDVHPGGNPHFMLDPRNGIVLSKALAERLSKLEPKKQEYFAKRQQAYAADLEKRIAEWKMALLPLQGKLVVTYHKSWVYFTEWVGLKEAGYVEPKPGIPPSPEHVLRLIKMMREIKVKLAMIEPYYPKGTAQEIAKETGAKLLVVPSEVNATDEAKTYIGLFDSIVRILTAVAVSG